MKFVFLTQYYPPEIGGAQVLMSSLAAEVRRQGHDVRVVTSLPNYPIGKIFPGYRRSFVVREFVEGIPTFRTWVYAVQTARLAPRLLNYFSFCVTSLLSFFWLEKPDVIFVDSPPLFLGLTALFLARAKGARCVVNISDLWPDAVADSGLVHSGILLRLARTLERFLYRHADLVCAVTTGIRTILIEAKSVPKDKILFLPVGVDTNLFRPRPADQDLLAKTGLTGKTLFIYAGTIGHAQGLGLLLDAAEALRGREDIVVVLVGDGPVKTQLQSDRDRRKLANVVFFAPVALTEMPGWWSVARGALVPLKDQPIHLSARPSKAMPALASGVPVIFSGCGEMATLLLGADAGLVVAPQQVAPLVESMLLLANSPQTAHRLGENGRRLCEDELSWNNVVGRWLADVARSINRERGRPKPS